MVMERGEKNENKVLTMWDKLLTRGRHVAGMKPRIQGALRTSKLAWVVRLKSM